MIDENYFLSPRKLLPNGKVIDVIPLTFGRARITLSSHIDSALIDDSW